MHIKVTKLQARRLSDYLETAHEFGLVPDGGSFVKALSLALDKAQAADISAGDENVISIEVVESLN